MKYVTQSLVRSKSLNFNIQYTANRFVCNCKAQCQMRNIDLSILFFLMLWIFTHFLYSLFGGSIKTSANTYCSWDEVRTSLWRKGQSGCNQQWGKTRFFISFLEPVTAMTQRGEETSEMGLRNLEDLAQDVAVDRTLYGNDHDVLHFNMPQRIRRPKSWSITF